MTPSSSLTTALHTYRQQTHRHTPTQIPLILFFSNNFCVDVDLNLSLSLTVTPHTRCLLACLPPPPLSYQLSACLPQIVPRLVDAGSDPHPKVTTTPSQPPSHPPSQTPTNQPTSPPPPVDPPPQVKEGAKAAMLDISSVIRNPEISRLSPVLLAALADPSSKVQHNTTHHLNPLTHTHTVIPPSYILLYILSHPLIHRLPCSPPLPPSPPLPSLSFLDQGRPGGAAADGVPLQPRRCITRTPRAHTRSPPPPLTLESLTTTL